MTTPITSAGQISSAGDYCLANDITVASGDGLWLSTSGAVNIDLNGYTLRSTETGNAQSVGILSTGSATVTVKGPGKITGFRFGADIYGTGIAREIDLSGIKYCGANLRGANSQAVLCYADGIGGVTDEAYSIGINMTAGGGLIRANYFRNFYRQAGASLQISGEGVPIIVGSGATGSCRVERNVCVNDVHEVGTIGAYLGTGATHYFDDNWIVGFCTGVWGGRQATGPMYAKRNGLWTPANLAGSRGVYGDYGLWDNTNNISGFETPIAGTMPQGVPTGCVWNSAQAGTGVAYSNGNLSVKQPSGTAGGSAICTEGKSSGKHYFELTYTTAASLTAAMVGVTRGAHNQITNLATTGADDYWYDSSGRLNTNGSPADVSGKTIWATAGDTVGVLLDLDSMALDFIDRNGATIAGFTGLSAGTYYPIAGIMSGAAAANLVTANFAGPFFHTVPSGFTAFDV